MVMAKDALRVQPKCRRFVRWPHLQVPSSEAECQRAPKKRSSGETPG